jgi:hypothetical protein
VRGVKPPKVTREELQELYDDARREVLGFPSPDASPHIECLFRPTFHHEAAMFVFLDEDRPAEILVRAATASIGDYVDRVMSAATTDLAAIARPPVITARAVPHEASCASLRTLVAASIEAPIVRSIGRGRDGMHVDVVLRDGATTARRELFTVDDEGEAPLGMLVRSAIELAMLLFEHTPVAEHVRTIHGCL